MTGKRETNLRQLEEASEVLSAVNDQSPRPAHVLRHALQQANAAYTDMQSYLGGKDKGVIRVNVLRIRGVLEALDDNRRVSSDDYRAVARASRELGSVAQGIRDRATRAPNMEFSVTGSRFSNRPVLDRDVPTVMVNGGRHMPAVGVLDETLQDRWHDMEGHRARVPKSLKAGSRFTIFRCPLVVYTKGFIGDAQLNRSGLTWSRLSGGIGSGTPGGKTRGAGDQAHALLLDNQLLIGMSHEDLAADRDGTIRRACDQIQQRLGRLTPPQGENGRFLVSPGSKLDWLWLVPNNVMLTTHLTVREVSFPWKTEHVVLTEGQRLSHQREIKAINDAMSQHALEGKELQPGLLSRQSQLLEELDRDRGKHASGDPEERRKTLAKRRAAMQQAIDMRTRNLVIQLKDVMNELKTLDKADKKTRILLKAEQKKYSDAIQRITDEEMRKARAAL